MGRFDPRSRVRVGDRAEVEILVSNLHFFDPTTLGQHPPLGCPTRSGSIHLWAKARPIGSARSRKLNG